MYVYSPVIEVEIAGSIHDFADGGVYASVEMAKASLLKQIGEIYSGYEEYVKNAYITRRLVIEAQPEPIASGIPVYTGFDEQYNCKSCSYGYHSEITTGEEHHHLCGAKVCYECAKSAKACKFYNKGKIPDDKYEFRI